MFNFVFKFPIQKNSIKCSAKLFVDFLQQSKYRNALKLESNQSLLRDKSKTKTSSSTADATTKTSTEFDAEHCLSLYENARNLTDKALALMLAATLSNNDTLDMYASAMLHGNEKTNYIIFFLQKKKLFYFGKQLC